MKKIMFVLGLLVVLSTARAAVVSPQTAQKIAVNFFKVNAASARNRQVSATLVYTRTESDNTADYYIFNISPVKGFVIVSADDNLTPVIGYSTETNFNLNVTGHSINSWMQTTARKIHHSIRQQIPANETITGLWNAYATGQQPNAMKSSSVGPLLQTTWDQSPYYNALCPYNSTDQQQCVTGCVATAMAQVMKYWAYPPKGQGSYSYDDAPPAFSYNYGVQSANFGNTVFDWNNMPLSLSDANNDVDTLMYECGVSVAMDYGDDNQGGSGAWVLQVEAGAGQPCAQYAYVNYFLYDANTIQGVQMVKFTANDWMNLMLGELNANRVIQYEGDDTSGAGGHTWVCDGYDANSMLHMNWGWSGQNDGYFAVTNLDAGQYNFDDDEGALIGIQPPPPFAISAAALSASVCPGGSTTLTATGPATATFSWTPTTGLSCPTCATTTVTPGSNMIYSVTADSDGVTGSATVAVSITGAVQAAFAVQKLPTCSVPADITFTNNSNNATNYIWTFGDGTTDTAASPVHAYNNYGTFNVQLVAMNACGADSILQNQVVTVTNHTPVLTGASICTGETATLTAAGAGQLSWYTAATNGTLLDTGATFTTPALNTSTTYYVSSTIPSPVNSAGPVDNTFGGGSYFTGSNQHSIIFNCTAPQTLLTVDVYAQTAGQRIIMLQDSNGTQLEADTINVAAGESTITLNMPLPVANELYLAINGNIGLYRNNSSANYPYYSSDSTVVLTGSDAGVAGYYYFFYNWQLQQAPCVTAPMPVVASVLATGSGSFGASVSGNTVNFSTPATGISYNWNFGDGNTSTVQNPSHTYAANGTYTVTLIETNGNCTDTITQSITTGTSGINDISGITGLALFPNPAKEELTINVNTDKPLNGCALVIRNMMGQDVTIQNVDLGSGANTVTMDVSNLSSGVYLLSLQNGKENVTRRFVKAN